MTNAAANNFTYRDILKYNYFNVCHKKFADNSIFDDRDFVYHNFIYEMIL